MPQSLKVNLSQQTDKTLVLKNIALEESYSPDYRVDLKENYYLMKIFKGEDILFEGKTPASYVLIYENFNKPKTDLQARVEEQPLKDFSLYLPYYKEADTLRFYNQEGTEVLSIDLLSVVVPPKITTQSCGDGICADNENILMCHKDCTSTLQQILPQDTKD